MTNGEDQERDPMTTEERAKHFALRLVDLLTESGRMDHKELGVLKELEARRVVDQFVAASRRHLACPSDCTSMQPSRRSP
jgi:hypothetical protein